MHLQDPILSLTTRINSSHYYLLEAWSNAFNLWPFYHKTQFLPSLHEFLSMALLFGTKSFLLKKCLKYNLFSLIVIKLGFGKQSSQLSQFVEQLSRHPCHFFSPSVQRSHWDHHYQSSTLSSLLRQTHGQIGGVDESTGLQIHGQIGGQINQQAQCSTKTGS